MQIRHIPAAAGVVALTLPVSTALAGPDWVEVDDAGSTLATAQGPVRPKGAVSLRTISGTLTGNDADLPDFEDCYFFRVTDASSMSIRPITANFNATLYLFNITVNRQAIGLLANDNENSKSVIPQILPAASDGTGVLLTKPGDYLLAIAGSGRIPVSRTGAIFNFQSPTEISGPDGPGGLNPLQGWSGTGVTGSYTLEFTSADFPLIPSPGSAAILALSGIALGARRRR